MSTLKTATAVAHETVGRMASFDAQSLNGQNSVSIARAAVITDRRQGRELGLLSRFIEAYEAYDGQDLGFFLHIWEGYLAGEDEPCPETDDGLHEVTAGSCDQCGSKNRN